MLMTLSGLALAMWARTKPIKVVLFKDENKIQLKKGQEIEVTGKLKIYQKDFEIEAKEIKII